MTHTPATPPRDARVGLLYPGEMGTAVADLLRHDHRVVTTRAGEVAALFEGKMTVRVLGDAPGQASALRMLLSGLTKGVIALFVELALAARQAGILDRTLAAYRASYPGILEVVERTLPTYP